MEHGDLKKKLHTTYEYKPHAMYLYENIGEWKVNVYCSRVAFIVVVGGLNLISFF